MGLFAFFSNTNSTNLIAFIFEADTFLAIITSFFSDQRQQTADF
jgi:hypothetical protein